MLLTVPQLMNGLVKERKELGIVHNMFLDASRSLHLRHVVLMIIGSNAEFEIVKYIMNNARLTGHDNLQFH